MKRIIILSLLCLSGLSLKAQEPKPQYNKALADSLGADEYGMKMYYLVLLKTGPEQIADKEKVKQLFAGHMENIGRLAQAGKLVVAGPMGKNDKQYRGIFILAVKTRKEAEDLLTTDPAVKSGLLAVELYEWYGSAALPVYLDVHKQIEKTKH